MLEGVRELSWASFIRVLISLIRALPSWTNHLPKVPHSNTITLGIKISTYEIGREDTNIWTIAGNKGLFQVQDYIIQSQIPNQWNKCSGWYYYSSKKGQDLGLVTQNVRSTSRSSSNSRSSYIIGQWRRWSGLQNKSLRIENILMKGQKENEVQGKGKNHG